MAEPKSTFESAREWVVDHKLRTVGSLWLSGIAGSIAYNWSRPKKTSVKIIHASAAARAANGDANGNDPSKSSQNGYGRPPMPFFGETKVEVAFSGTEGQEDKKSEVPAIYCRFRLFVLYSPFEYQVAVIYCRFRLSVPYSPFEYQIY
ncbi:hypothetical protein F8388_022113 [Cannabis sativa]|uniref:HIG1 domain-containing protein n=1 Tax=Cannabis sativa TaxID=3483 RepID=A0A7J6G7S3_CANSA|nr:hypothetical protein F8388_022113 [Cannabis sativa]